MKLLTLLLALVNSWTKIEDNPVPRSLDRKISENKRSTNQLYESYFRI